MNEDTIYETFLFVGLKKFIISVNQKDDFKTIHKNEIDFSNELNETQFNKLNDFLDKNIFQIEKTLNYFIKNIYIILDHKEFLPIEISIKKQNYRNLILKDDLIYSLNEIKDYCKKTLEKKKIIHMLIDKYVIDDKSYFSLPDNLKSDRFSLDVRFICLPKEVLKNLEEILKKYQIRIQHLVEGNYVRSFDSVSDKDIFIKARDLIEGLNVNEIKLREKMTKNKGFFEKFFNLFS